MLNRSRSRYNGRDLPATFLQEMAFYGATDAWDFVNQSYLRAGRVTAPGLTFTRASAGFAETSDGRLVEFASGAPRITDRGFLIEGSKQNLRIRSQEFNLTAAWTQAGTSVTTNAVIAPDGTNTAEKLVESAATELHRLRGAGGTAASISGTVTLSIFAKAAERSLLIIREDEQTGELAYFNLSAGSVTLGTAVTEPTAAKITAYANGWYRCELVVSGISSVADFDLRISSSVGDGGSYAGNGTSGLYIWGAQLEAGSFASSYVKTEGSAVTRAADDVEASLSGVAYPLSLFSEFVRTGDTGAAEGILQVDASSRAQRAALNINSSDQLEAVTRGGANDGDAAVTGAVSVGAITKTAGRIEADKVQAARASALATEDTIASVPTSVPDTVRFGDYGATGTPGFLYLRNAAIVTRALTDAELQGLTT